MIKKLMNNQVTILGKIDDTLRYSHESCGEHFYTADVKVKRLSEQEDRIPVLISERLMDVTQDHMGEYIEIQGQFRSFNLHRDTRSQLLLKVFAREIHKVNSEVLEEPARATSNKIYLDGYLCKEPVYRKTPLGREVADLLLAVNRPYGKSDYIPCISWGRNARFTSNIAVGSHLLIWGRIQSRDYMKKRAESEPERRTAYEVSVSKLEYYV